jgi:hypothetical protein
MQAVQIRAVLKHLNGGKNQQLSHHRLDDFIQHGECTGLKGSALHDEHMKIARPASVTTPRRSPAYNQPLKTNCYVEGCTNPRTPNGQCKQCKYAFMKPYMRDYMRTYRKQKRELQAEARRAPERG